MPFRRWVCGPLLALLLAACSVAPAPVVRGVDGRPLAPGEGVVVLVPGVTGAVLREPGGRVVWGDGRSIFRRRDRGWAMALPLVGPGGELEVVDVVREVRLLGVVRKQAYGPVVRLMAANGYPPGDLRRPDAEARFFVFPYDWRRDNLESVAELAERLETLRRLRGEERLRVSLVCQSNGAHICRWLAKYGGAGLEEAEAGGGGPGKGLEVAHVVLVGTSNGGSLRILRLLDRGRVYVPVVGRRWGPETLFTFRSLFEDLPVYRDDLFVDGEGRPLAVDLFDPQSWRRYGWSVYGEEVAALARRGELPASFGGRDAWNAYLADRLARARRFHRLLAADAPGFGATRYHLIQSRHLETAERAVLIEEDGTWRTLFSEDRRVRRAGLAARTTAAGDGHATLESQGHLSPQERSALAGETLYLQGAHFEMILDPAAQRRLIEILAD